MNTRLLTSRARRCDKETQQRLAAKPLTSRQQEVYDFMRAFYAENDQLPPSALIATHFGWKSGTSAQQHIASLIRLRRIETNAVGKLRFVREA